MSSDLTRRLQEQVTTAAVDKRPVNIIGSNSKAFLGQTAIGEPLEVSGHRGILSYEPKELVITARGGTPLAEIEATLAKQGQMLAFEPPWFGPDATLGGTIACGLSGPRRPYAGSARDFVLGVRLLNGRGEVLRFGGEVMKNVAGYDLSRLMTGAMGTLGVLLDISLKVLPIPACEITLIQQHGLEDALQQMQDWLSKPLPLSATFADGEQLYIRLSGARSAVVAASQLIGGDTLNDPGTFWRERVREQGDSLFQDDRPVWRLSVPPTAPLVFTSEEMRLEWGGGQRWLKSGLDAQTIQQAAKQMGGHARLFRNRPLHGEHYAPLPAPLMTLHRRLKQAFDPQGLFNPGRLYANL